jgi:hypothetical protein
MVSTREKREHTSKGRVNNGDDDDDDDEVQFSFTPMPTKQESATSSKKTILIKSARKRRKAALMADTPTSQRKQVKTLEDEDEDDEVQFSFTPMPTEPESASSKKTILIKSARKRRKTVLMADTPTFHRKEIETLEEEEGDSDDEVVFTQSSTSQAGAGELSDKELAHKYKCLYESACMKLIYSEDRITQLEEQLTAKAECPVENTENNRPIQNKAPQPRAARACSSQISIPRAAPPVVFDDGTEAELKKMKAKLRKTKTSIGGTPSKQKRTDTRSALLESLAFRRGCVAADSPEGSPCADDGAFGTPPPKQWSPNAPRTCTPRTSKRLTELY